MPTFDVAGTTRQFAADLGREMDRCDNGEGMECATTDATLLHYSILCCQFGVGARTWGQAVFSGRIPFDPEDEQTWLETGRGLRARAVQLLEQAKRAEVPCYELAGQSYLDLAVKDLSRLLENWVTPRLAVAPSARRRAPLPEEVAQEARRRIASLPPLPRDWLPAVAGQGCTPKE